MVLDRLLSVKGNIAVVIVSALVGWASWPTVNMPVADTGKAVRAHASQTKTRLAGGCGTIDACIRSCDYVGVCHSGRTNFRFLSG